MDTIITNGIRGWRADSSIDLGLNGLTLKLTTRKRYGGVVCSTISAVRIEKSVCGTYAMETSAPFSDYNATVIRFPDIKRVTGASIKKAHDMALDHVDEHIAKAKVYYTAENSQQAETV